MGYTYLGTYCIHVHALSNNTVNKCVQVTNLLPFSEMPAANMPGRCVMQSATCVRCFLPVVFAWEKPSECKVQYTIAPDTVQLEANFHQAHLLCSLVVQGG